MSSGEVNVVASASVESEDGFYDDPRSDGKKKKFKPFQKVKNFFRGGSSKKRFKVEEGPGGKSLSTGALHHHTIHEGEDDDEGGFRRPAGLAGSRSISEDSIFKPEVKEPTIGVLQGHAVSMEGINSKFQTELFSKLKGKQSDSDIDEGLPYSPLPLAGSSHMIFDTSMKPGTDKSTSRESDKSLISVDGSDDDLFASNWKSGVASVKTRTSSMDSLPDMSMEVSDFEAVSLRSTLNNEAAKHRISVKPKSRRLSSKMSIKQKDRPSQQKALPDVKEESPTKTQTPAEVKPSQHKTVISTTIPIGSPTEPGVNVIPRSEVNDIPRSDVRDIPQGSRTREDLSASRPRSMSPLSTLSTSPVSSTMLQDVKLRPRPVSGKFDNINVKKDTEEPKNELSHAFNKAKRFSKKYDDDGKVVDFSKSVIEKESDYKKQQSAMSTSKNAEVLRSELKSPTTITNKPESPVTSPMSPGVCFVLKKEPLRPGGNRASESTAVKSNADTKDSTKAASVTISVKEKETVDTKSVNIKTEKVPTPETETKPVFNKSTNSFPEKLASPRDEYRLKRAARSKTLPVSKEMVDKAEEGDVLLRSTNRLGSPPLDGRNRAGYDNVVIGAKPMIQSKRASWASPSATTTSESSWLERTRAKKPEQEKVKEESETTKEVKIEIKSNAQPQSNVSVNVDKPDSQIHTDKQKDTTIVDKTNDKASDVKAANDKPAFQSSTRSWAQTHSAKPFDKPGSVGNAKVSNVQTGKVSFDKPSVQSVKPVTTQSGIKTSINSQSAGVKPSVTTSGVKPAVLAAKPTITNQSITKPTVTNQPVTKPTITSQSAVSKPTFSTSSKPASEKTTVTSSVKSANPLSQSVRPSFENKSQIGAKTGGFERSFSQKAGTGLPKSGSEPNKPTVQSSTARPLASVNTNITNTDGGKISSATDFRKTFSSQDTKKVEIETKQDTNISSSVKQGNAFDKSKTVSLDRGAKLDTKTSASVPAWKQALNQRKTPTPTAQPVKIEIIDKSADKPVTKKIDEKPQKSIGQIKDKPKPAPEKCSNVAGNRSSKVLDMVKSFQNLQVT